MPSLRQQLWEAIRDRLRTIRTAAGYETEIGARFFAWRDLANSPLDEIKDLGPCFTMKDSACETEQRVSNRMDHVLKLEIQGAVWGTPPDNAARSAIADIEKCLGVDRQWSINDVKLALDTRLVSDQINVVHLGEKFAVVTKIIEVDFRTASFNPYSQT